MVVWVLDNLEEILTILKWYQVDIEEAVEILLERVPDKSWELLKPYKSTARVNPSVRLYHDFFWSICSRKGARIPCKLAPAILPRRSSKVIGISKELPTRFEDDNIMLIWYILKYIGLEIQSYLHL